MAGEALILQDINGTRHVYADNNYNLFFGFGYVMAQDRLFQMEMRKRQALGRTAEVLGKGEKARPNKYIEIDRDQRIAIDTEEVKAGFAMLHPLDRMLVEAFTTGINKAVQEVLEKPDLLPRPFVDYGFLPQLWTPLQTMATAMDVLAAYSSFSTQLINMRLYEFLRAKYPEHCDDIFDQLLWNYDANAPTTVRNHQMGGADPEASGPRGCAKEGATPNHLVLSQKSYSNLVPPVRPDQLEPRRASMSWMVGSDRAKNFRSLFVNGPQPGWHVPSYYYPIGLHGGDFDLVGFAAEGSFIIHAGANRDLSWGLTAGLGHQADHYQEQLREPGSFEYRGREAWRKLETRQEVIKVKGSDDHVETIYSSEHGPIVAFSEDGRFAYAKQLSWRGKGVQSVMEWLNLSRTRNYEDWLERTRGIAFSYNLFYAGKDGQVGFSFTGRYPDLVPGHDRRLPAAGGGAYEWRGLLPPDRNPSLVTTGYLVNFNNKPAKDWPNSGLFWEQWAEANQVKILYDALEKKDKLAWNDIWDINRIISHTDVSASYFIPAILEAAKNLPKDSAEAKAAGLLADWDQMRVDRDGDGFFDHPGQAIFDAWLPIMVRNTIEPTLRGVDSDILAAWTSTGYGTRPPRLEEHPSAGTLVTHHALLSRQGKSGVHHHYDFFQGKDVDLVIIDSLRLALTDLRERNKGPMEDWRRKVTPQVFFDTNTLRVPMSSPGTQIALPLYANRGAINLQVGYELDGDAFIGYVAPPGPSGFIPPTGKPADNPRFGNHLMHYRDFRLFGFFLDRKSVEAHMSAPPVRLKIPDFNESKL